MKVRALTVGPIVGATEPTMARVWGRAERASENGHPLRCFAIGRIRPKGGTYRNPVVAKMNPNFDMTGVVVFQNLEASRLYEFQLGWFYADLEMEELEGLGGLDWSEASAGSFCTASSQDSDARSFLFGSCRYLLRLFGTSFFDDRGDKTFRSMQEGHLAGANPPNLMLLVGDQIYADDLNFLKSDNAVEEYYRRYRATFSQPHQRGVMANLPTYMILDDHEIEDNWPAKAADCDWLTKYPAAMHAYLTYQGSHSPLLPVTDAGRLDGIPEKLWYTFRDGCCDFFVLDTRTERRVSTGAEGEAREIVGRAQMEALKAWLDDGADRVKLVVSSVPVFPDSRHLSDDKWSGFPAQRAEVLDHIRSRSVRRVVFLSGDIHVSLSAELLHSIDDDFQVISVVSSSLFWPYPHPRRTGFQLEGRLVGQTTEYKLGSVGGVWSEDNFTRVDVGPAGLVVRHYARKGALLGEVSYLFKE